MIDNKNEKIVPENNIMLKSNDNHIVIVKTENIKKYIGEQFIMHIEEGNNIIEIPVCRESLEIMKHFFDTGEWDGSYKLEPRDISIIPLHNHTHTEIDINTYSVLTFLGIDVNVIIKNIYTRYLYAIIFIESTKNIRNDVIAKKINEVIAEKITKNLYAVKQFDKYYVKTKLLKIYKVKIRGFREQEVVLAGYDKKVQEQKEELIKLQGKYIEYIDIYDVYNKVNGRLNAEKTFNDIKHIVRDYFQYKPMFKKIMHTLESDM